MPFIAFIRHQVSLMVNVDKAEAKEKYTKTCLQSAVVSASSLFYLFPAVVCYLKSANSLWFTTGASLYCCARRMSQDGLPQSSRPTTLP